MQKFYSFYISACLQRAHMLNLVRVVSFFEPLLDQLGWEWLQQRYDSKGNKLPKMY